MSKKHMLLQPHFVANFTCTGSACADNCCMDGWQIPIDKTTYQKYRKCQDKELRVKLDKAITRSRKDVPDALYAKVKLDRQANCPFLDEDKLCTLQRRLGEEFLSDTCLTYPRSTNIVNGVYEKSLSVSCPEVTRLALLNPDLMEFDEVEEDNTVRNNIDMTFNSDSTQLIDKTQNYFWDIRVFTISLLQNRKYPLWKRLVILGLFCRKLEQLSHDGKSSEFPQTINSFVEYIENDVFKEELDAIPQELTIQMEIMKELIDQRIFLGVGNRRFLESYHDFLTGIEFVPENTIEETGKKYAEASEKYYRPFMESHEYILENYLVYYVFKNLFPFGRKGIFNCYVMLVLHYAMIKMFLIGIAGLHKEQFNEEHVIKLIQSFSRSIEHSQKYLQAVFHLLENNQLNTLPYMAILIKN